MSSTRSVWKRIDENLIYTSIPVLIVILLYLYSSFVETIIPPSYTIHVEIGLLIYFGFELLVKYMISDNIKRFIGDYWWYILLLFPFFKSLKVIGKFGRLVKGARYIKYLQKLIKVPKILWKYLKSVFGKNS